MAPGTGIRDIRYRGIFTYRGLRLFALVMMTLSQFSAVLLVANKATVLLGEALLSDSIVRLLNMLRPLGQATFPLLLISSIAIVFNGDESFKRMLITYFLLALLTYLAIVLILSDFLRILIEDIPQLLPSIAKGARMGETVNAVLVKVFRALLPGDGNIHLEGLNNFIQTVGGSVNLPDQEGLIRFISKFGLDESTVRSIFSTVGNLNANDVANVIQNFGTMLFRQFPEAISKYWDTLIYPWVSSRINVLMNINVFWDLFLYSLFYFFIEYTPKKLRGGKILLFRCCALLPALWLVISAMVSSSLKTTMETAPVWFTALLGGRNLSALLVFFLLVLFEKYRHLEFKDKHADADWNDYRDSKKSSLYFSIYTSCVLIFVSLLEYGLSFVPGLSEWGIGSSYHMWVAAPVLMLFSYNKIPKYKVFNAAIPLYYILHFVGLLLLVSAMCLTCFRLLIS